MVQRSHDVGLALPSLTDEDNGSALAWPDRLDSLQNVGRRVRDLQELGRGHLRGAGVVGVGKLDRRALKALAPELRSQFQPKHGASLPGSLR